MIAYPVAGLVGFIGMLVGGLISPLVNCFCCGPLGGLLAGVGTCALGRPGPGQDVRTGALGGVAFGGGGLLGALVATLVNVALVGPEGTVALLRQLGLPADPAAVQFGQAVGGCLGGLFALFLAVGAGALGGLLWRSLGRSGSGGAAV